jgi:hypothetical protein
MITPDALASTNNDDNFNCRKYKTLQHFLLLGSTQPYLILEILNWNLLSENVILGVYGIFIDY